TEEEVSTQAAYVEQQELDGYDRMVRHGLKRKEAFDRRVEKQTGKEVVFAKGDLVQVHKSELENTFKTEKKLMPRWSVPRRVVER
ncbi:hypothetical protein K435DRAFT_604962, partial [Dendrothele bispora CBS 962.96]